jgi:hypothetical protein
MWSLAAPEPDALPFPGMVTMDGATHRYHHDSNLAAVAYSAQANGFFEKLRRLGPAGLPDPVRRLYGSPANIAKLPLLESIATDLRVSVTAASVAYLLNHEFPGVRDRRLYPHRPPGRFPARGRSPAGRRVDAGDWRPAPAGRGLRAAVSLRPRSSRVTAKRRRV